jgi:thioesterase domain-containing protein/acyl carrier protein
VSVSALGVGEPAVVEARVETVAGLFAEVFDLPAVGVEDDFFRLGGDSLIGQSLLTAVEQRYGVSLSLSVFLEAPTPSLLAERIDQRQKAGAMGARPVRELPPHLMAINPDRASPPLFLVHGNTGESVAPQQLAKAFADRTFYAFRALGLEPGEKFLNTMDAIANNYLSVIQKLYPKGDLVILGHCAGAMIAYDMAQRLAAKGRKGVALVMVDPEVAVEHAPFLFNSGLKLTMLQTSWKKRVANLDLAARTNPAVHRERRREFVTACVKAAIGPYAPKPYSGQALLLCTDDRRDALLDPRRGYPTFMRNLETVRLFVDHRNIFTTGAAEIGAAVNRFISRALPGSN